MMMTLFGFFTLKFLGTLLLRFTISLTLLAVLLLVVWAVARWTDSKPTPKTPCVCVRCKRKRNQRTLTPT